MVGVSENRRDTVKRGSKKLSRVRVQGATPNMAEISNVDLEGGRFFTPAENAHSSQVTIIGTDVRDEIFGKLDPIGRTITIGDHPFKVIGLLRKQGSVLGQSQDNQLWIPINAFRKQFGIRSTLDLFIKAKDGVPGIQRSIDDVRVILRGRRRTSFRGDDPFGTVSAEAVQQVWKNISAGGFALMIFISGISLVVGGIVIMNIMLVSVIERTREIGVRRALGATKKNIRTQFLTEAMLLSLGGGVVGVALGYMISKAISTFFPLPTLVRPSLVISGLLIAVFTGALAGYFPARRAARLPPVDALRYE
jgi:putative ABC transport system permease protein